MRLIITTLLLLFVVSCKNQKNNNSDSKLDVFNSILGNEKSMALNNAVASFEKFLERNFSAYSNDQERMVEFLKLIQRGDLPDTNWILDTKNNRKIIEEFESSGLRRSFRLFGYEEDSLTFDNDSLTIEEIINGESSEIDDSIDSSAYFFKFGLFLQALDSISGSDTLINEYFSARQMGNIPYESLAVGELATGIDLENPIHKRILIIDFYYDLMNWDIERNEKNESKNLTKKTNIKHINKNTQIYKFNPGKPVLKFIGEQIINDSVKLKPNYIIRIEIPGIPDSLISVAITNGKISRTNKHNEFTIHPYGIGLMGFSIGFKDSLNAKRTNHISEEWIFLK